MPTGEGQKADCVRSYGMKLSWDINDPQMPQVCDTRPERTRAADYRRVVFKSLQRLWTEDARANKQMRVLKCKWTLQREELGLEVYLHPALSLSLSENTESSGNLQSGSKFPVLWRGTPRPLLSFN